VQSTDIMQWYQMVKLNQYRKLGELCTQTILRG